MSGEIWTDPVKGTTTEDTEKIPHGRGSSLETPPNLEGNMTEDTERTPSGRRRSLDDPPYLSELRIVLLGRSGPQKSKVGNIILGREAFEVSVASFIGQQQCERARGLVNGRRVTVISTPDLLHPQLTVHKLNKALEMCVFLSDPGPHAFLLVVQRGMFTEQDRVRVKGILGSFSADAVLYSLVLTDDDHYSEGEDPISKIINECGGRYQRLDITDQTDTTQVTELMEKIDKIVKDNEERCLDYEMYWDPQSAEIQVPERALTGSEEEMEKNMTSQALPGEELEKFPQTAKLEDFMSELRIVLLGTSTEEMSKVGNLILGRDAFKTCSKEGPALVKDQCERAEGQVEERRVVMINPLDLLDPQLSGRKLFYQIERCVSLAAPGPHVFLLVLPRGGIPKKNSKHLKLTLSYFGNDAFEYSLVLLTQGGKKPLLCRENPVDKFIKKCGGRNHTFISTRTTDRVEVTELLKKMDQMVKNRNYLNCEIFKEPESASAGDRLNVVLCGRRGAGKTSAGNTILGLTEPSADPSSSSVCVKRQGVVCGRLVTVVELPALYNTQLSEKEVMCETHRCISLCDPGVHAFLLVTPVGNLTDEDRGEILKIQQIFGTKVTDYMMVLFTCEFNPSSQSLQEFFQKINDTQQLLNAFGNRYCIINNQVISNNPKVPQLLGIIEKISETTESCFSLDMYWEAQMERRVRELEAKHKSELENKNRKIKELEEKVNFISPSAECKDLSTDCVRIVLVGKTGNGKSATGNTILNKEQFKSQLSFESVTTCCKKGIGEVAGRSVAVVDTPGLFDTKLSNEDVQQEIAKCISLLAPGPHVFLLVLSVLRFTNEERETLRLIKSTFGRHAGMFTIVLFTRGDELGRQSIESLIQKADPAIQNLIQDCGGRYQVFNNKNMNNRTQVSELLQKIYQMVQKNGGGCYTNEMFQEAELAIKQECERILKEKEEEIQKEREILKEKHEKEMEEMRRRVKVESHKVEKERELREKELKNKEIEINKIYEQLKQREEKEKERRNEEDKQRKDEEDRQWRKKFEDLEEEKKKMKEDWQRQQQRREEEENERQEKEKREREKFRSEKMLSEIKKAEEKQKRDEEEKIRKTTEERERLEWENRIKEAEKGKNELQEEMKKKAEEWEKERRVERRKKNEEEKKRICKEEKERIEWEEKQKRMVDAFEMEREHERQKREREEQRWKEKEKKQREMMELEVEEMKRKIKKQQEDWEKERQERMNKVDEQRREERRNLQKLQDDYNRERKEEDQKRKMEDQARRKREEDERKELEEEYERKIKDMKRRYEEEARRQAEEFNDFKAKYTREFCDLSEKHNMELINLQKSHQKQFDLVTELSSIKETSMRDEITSLKEQHEKEINELQKRYEKKCVIL